MTCIFCGGDMGDYHEALRCNTCKSLYVTDDDKKTSAPSFDLSFFNTLMSYIETKKLNVDGVDVPEGFTYPVVDTGYGAAMCQITDPMRYILPIRCSIVAGFHGMSIFIK